MGNIIHSPIPKQTRRPIHLLERMQLNNRQFQRSIIISPSALSPDYSILIKNLPREMVTTNIPPTRTVDRELSMIHLTYIYSLLIDENEADQVANGIFMVLRRKDNNIDCICITVCNFEFAATGLCLQF